MTDLVPGTPPEVDYTQIPVHDQMTQARIAGHSWGDIDQGVAAAREQAIKSGATPPEVDNKFGLPGSSALEARFRADALKAQAEDQDFKFNIETSGQNPNDGPLTTEARWGYRNALMSGETGGPGDYASKAGDVTPYVEPLAQAPSHSSVIDSAIDLAAGAGLEPDVKNIRTIKGNLLDHWAATGEPPDQAVLRAHAQPSFYDSIILPQKAPLVGAQLEAEGFDSAQRSVLQHIANGEAQRYNELYGGGTFGDYSKFPTGVSAPAEKGHLHAGLYQFDEPTFNEQAKALGLKDFSPPSQDHAAWNLASTEYLKNTGRDLHADAQAGNVQWAALAGRWTSLSTHAVGQEFAQPGTGAEGVTPEVAKQVSDTAIDYLKGMWDDLIKKLPEGQEGPIKITDALDPQKLSSAINIALGVAGADTTAFHGTHAEFAAEKGAPFGRFQLNFIGTGEGAQAYGHGIYLAEDKGISEWYKKSVTQRNAAGTEGHLYQVHIKAPEEDFLHWDKPFAQQSPKVQSAIRKILATLPRSTKADPTGTGGEIHDALTQWFGKQSEVAEKLKEAGIPGIRYLDANSRGKPIEEQTHNYVLFDPSVVEITHRNGIAVPKNLISRLSYLLGQGGNLEAGLENIRAELDKILAPFDAVEKLFGTEEQIAAKRVNKAARGRLKLGIIEEAGKAERYVAQAAKGLEQYRKLASKGIDEYERWIKSVKGSGTYDRTNAPDLALFNDHMENRGELPEDHPLRPMADALRNAYTKMMAEIHQYRPDAAMIADYVRHSYKEANKAMTILGNARVGTGASLRQRTLPISINEAIAQGLTPRFIDPIENAIHYIQGLRSFLATKEVLKHAEEIGDLHWNQNGPPPKGWIKVPGHLAQRPNGGQAYASQGFVNVWNAWVGRGFYDWGTNGKAGQFYDIVNSMANSMVAFKLGLSGYHYVNIAVETIASGFTGALGAISRGQPIRAAKSLASGVTIAPRILKGRELQRAYEDPSRINSPAERQILDIATRAGVRFVGRGEAYMVGARAGWVRAIQRGVLTKEWKAGISHITDVEGMAPGMKAIAVPARTVEFIGQEVGRVADTLMGPLFDKFVPYVKLGAWHDEMTSWLAANKNASEDVVMNQAHRIWDRMEDGFGELNQDRLFWPRVVKQMLNTATISVGWEFGSLRMLGGAARDLAHLDITSPRMRWVLGYPMAYSLIGAIYGYLRGQGWSHTLGQSFFPPTGGKTPEGAPQRAAIPGYPPGYMSAYEIGRRAYQQHGGVGLAVQAPLQWAGTKLGPLPQELGALATGNDWRGQDLVSRLQDQQGNVPAPYKSYLKNAWNIAAPIMLQQEQGTLRGNKIMPLETWAGIRPAPSWFEDPEREGRTEREHEKRIRSEQGSTLKHMNNRLAYPPK